jgi:alkanesulfonate monooxygenase SsuD/methylene tetrahydromethanopterin reductase-like flavin-dependent oxidoreductase (luciferase family)
LAASGRSLADFQLSYPAFIATGTNEQEMSDATAGVRRQIAFYGSTPAYRPVLELHGWGDLQTELNTLSKRGEWVKMGELIDDEVLDAFAVVGEPEQVASKVLERFGDVIDRVSFYMPYAGDQRRSSAILTGFKAGSS